MKKFKNSKIVDFQEYQINRDYYIIGLLIGALRAELENGNVALESVYGLLTDGTKSALRSDAAFVGVVTR